MTTYSIVLDNGQEVIRQLIKEADVWAEEIQQQGEVCFVSPFTINKLSHKVEIAIVIVREGTKLDRWQNHLLEEAVLTHKASIVIGMEEKDAVRRLKAWFPPKAWSPPKALDPSTGVAV